MGYLIRILGKEDPDLHINELVDALKGEGLSAELHFDLEEKPENWTIIDVFDTEARHIAQVQRNAVTKKSEASAEISILKKNIQKCKPTSAIKWIEDFFSKTKVMYLVFLLEDALEDNNPEIINCIKATLRDRTKGIIQADDEGFSNEEGFFILWQFNEDIVGELDCAVLDADGNWETFTMDLADAIQRVEFKSGQVPLNAKPI